MLPIVDVIARLRRIETDGSRSDRKLATVVLADLEFASQASIVDLARRATVSEPTVTRFCRALGCDGIREFKFRLAQAIAVGGIYLSERPSEISGERRIVDTIADGGIAALNTLRNQIDPTLVAEAGRRIARARSVLAFGSGGSSSIAAIELQHRLFRLGLLVTAHTDGELQRMTASVANSDTIVVGFSISGHVQSVVDSVAIAGQYGAGSIVATAPGSPLAQAADLAITFAIPEDGNLIYRPSPARYALIGIVDMLAMATADALGPKVLEGLRRIKQSLNTLKINDPNLPLGD
ncbi:MurR/RpiR family transcriptional regulator [Kaistia dalseonensis]|uniref:DNA-binding MurR/RpiR family transcriptional regulator n=1 Tax=Kaistia dalseonensis TaxID=410840 RepID=A0ABU0H784_9HYPH|nr:MurR/RpiR family transcriptional regulator [Kaistia dalseonensis]MCX5495306.1 MurR/RpiR family transcriptional regulator [Kaistia dalseonensis]MDQ0437892.1 DNA-binding MurR/RpiR family transcriptional regulator [Kaistia dalseonensis]